MGTLTRAGEATAIDQQVEQLQGELVQERDARLEERFYLTATIGALLDLIFFENGGVGAGTFFSLIYIAFLVIYSKRCGVEGVQEAISWAGQIVKLGGTKDDKKED